MPQTIILCPYLGLNDDPSVRLSYADGRHRCYALPEESAFAPDSEHQLRYCLASGHTGCSRYRQRQAGADTAAPSATTFAFATFSAAGCFVGVAGHHCTGSRVAVGSDCDGCGPAGCARRAGRPDGVCHANAGRIARFPDAGPAVCAGCRRGYGDSCGGPHRAATHRGGSARRLWPPGEVFLAVTPQAEAVGWVTSGEARGNHLGDSYLYTGIYSDELFHGVMQFDLSRVRVARRFTPPRCC